MTFGLPFMRRFYRRLERLVLKKSHRLREGAGGFRRHRNRNRNLKRETAGTVSCLLFGFFIFLAFGLTFPTFFVENGWVTLKPLIVLLALLFAPCLAFAQSFAQSFTVNGPFEPGRYMPLDGRERWQRWVREDGRSPAIHVESVATALYLQAIPDPSAWPRTSGGFARRLGSSYGSNLIQNTVQESMAAVEGTDPRYFACGCSGFFQRSGHALKMTFLTYNRNGDKTLDIPQLSGAYGSSMIEAVWWPHHYTALAQGVQTGHLEVGFIAAEHVVQEFSPELKRLFHLHFGKDDDAR
jgi:hypothetical protein